MLLKAILAIGKEEKSPPHFLLGISKSPMISSMELAFYEYGILLTNTVTDNREH